jgi:hypothetical protein
MSETARVTSAEKRTKTPGKKSGKKASIFEDAAWKPLPCVNPMLGGMEVHNPPDVSFQFKRHFVVMK